MHTMRVFSGCKYMFICVWGFVILKSMSFNKIVI